MKKVIIAIAVCVVSFAAVFCLTKVFSVGEHAGNSVTNLNEISSAGTAGIKNEKDDIYKDKEIEKLAAVLSLMSERCRAEIANGEAREFLSDLYAVLEEEKKYNADDIDLYYLVDKKHFLSENYVPLNLRHLEKNEFYNISRNDLSLRPEAEDSLREMAQAAKNSGITILVSSTYRSYEYQKNLFNYWVSVDGLEEAERESARAGTSQHQLGTAVDFGSITDDFAETEMGKWIYENASDFGWSLSFPQGYEDVTGYKWECWHFRFIGRTACEFQKKWFGNIQQFMLEFIDAWKNFENS